MKRLIGMIWQRFRLFIKLARMTPQERAAFRAELNERVLFEMMRKYGALHNMQPRGASLNWKFQLERYSTDTIAETGVCREVRE